MKKCIRIAVRFIVPVGIVFGLVSTMIWAQNGQDAQKAIDLPEASDKYEQAATVPSSDRLITFKLTLDNRAPVEVTQLEGGMIRIEKEGSWILGLTPYVRDSSTDEIAVKIFQISVITKENVAVGEGIVELQTLRPYKEEDKLLSSFTYGDSHFIIQLADKKKTLKSDIRPQLVEYYGNCCVTCDGVRICGCSVNASCGACCAPPCC